MIDNNIKITATLNDVKYRGDSGRRAYLVYYEFIDEDGTRYTGQYSRHRANNKGEAEANAQLGKQIEIYIDEQGDSILASKEPRFTYCLVLSIVFTTAECLVVAFVIAREALIAQNKRWIKKARG